MRKHVAGLVAAGIMACALLAACAAVSGLDQLIEAAQEAGLDVSDGSHEASADAAADTHASDVRPNDTSVDVAVDSTGAEASCPTGQAGPAMIPIPGDGFCVDSTEVTRSQYAQFLASNPANTVSECSWNSTFLPSHDWPIQAGEDGYPVDGVDWCDAYAYCAWAGKRLCGRIDGGAVPNSGFDDPTQSQWMAACTQKGALALPYGNAFVAMACNDVARDAGRTIAVASSPMCQGGFAGIFDMLGNADEWEDSCTPAADGGGDRLDLCRLRGDAFYDTVAGTTCGVGERHTRDFDDVDCGFRCCWP